MKLTSIDKAEAIRYLRYGSNIPDATISSIISECEQKLLDIINPLYTYKVFDKSYSENGDLVIPDYNIALTGQSIKKHMINSDKIVIMCATLSGSTDNLIRLQQVSDVTSALITDALSNAAIEQVCDCVCDQIKQKLPEYSQTSRFSPGYGDLPLQLQKSILTVLDAPKRIGVTCSSSSLLIPLKSVTALIGLSENSQPQEKRNCMDCNLFDTCQYRKNGSSCQK